MDLRRVSLPLPAALAPHGIAQIMFRQQTFTNCTCSHPHHTPHWSARSPPNRFGPLGLLNNDGCDCSHHAHLCCTQSAKLVVIATFVSTQTNMAGHGFRIRSVGLFPPHSRSLLSTRFPALAVVWNARLSASIEASRCSWIVHVPVEDGCR